MIHIKYVGEAKLYCGGDFWADDGCEVPILAAHEKIGDLCINCVREYNRTERVKLGQLGRLTQSSVDKVPGLRAIRH